ncbi:MAG: selenoneine biosynthesis selenosugar synthase SenB [Phycisphaerae bacterium]
MKILLVTPAPPGSPSGNRVTALRWARVLRGLGHRVVIEETYDGRRCDVLVALHARRSAAAVRGFHRVWPDAPIVVAMAGTDLYRDIHRSAAARRSMALATRLIVLQRAGVSALPPRHRAKARVIYQSARVIASRARVAKRTFDVCVLGHLRPVKDPFRTAMASRLVPDDSKLRVLHVGAALSRTMARWARAESRRNPRYAWLGALPRWAALRRLRRCRVLVHTSRMEGGANVFTEAIASGVPIVSSRIGGAVGMLGAGYPGYFPVGDTRVLADLLYRAETDARFYARLCTWCRRVMPLIAPERERRCWADLLGEVAAVRR